jgi:hypothetical protein
LEIFNLRFENRVQVSFKGPILTFLTGLRSGVQIRSYVTLTLLGEAGKGVTGVGVNCQISELISAPNFIRKSEYCPRSCIKFFCER